MFLIKEERNREKEEFTSHFLFLPNENVIQFKSIRTNEKEESNQWKEVEKGEIEKEYMRESWGVNFTNI